MTPKQIAIIFKYFSAHGVFARIRINGIIALDEDVLTLLHKINEEEIEIKGLLENYNKADNIFELDIITW